jgi:hypothetical protein
MLPGYTGQVSGSVWERMESQTIRESLTDYVDNTDGISIQLSL